MLLHFHYSRSPFPGGWSEAYSDAIQFFQAEKLIVVPTNVDAVVLTERGEAFVRMLSAMPLPVCTWSLPGPWTPSFPEGTQS